MVKQFLMLLDLKSDVNIWVKIYPKSWKIKKTTNRHYGNIPFLKPEVFPWITTHLDPVNTFTVLFNTYYEVDPQKNIGNLSVCSYYTNMSSIGPVLKYSVFIT